MKILTKILQFNMNIFEILSTTNLKSDSKITLKENPFKRLLDNKNSRNSLLQTMFRNINLTNK